MSVSTKYRSDFAIEKIAHGDLFAGGFGVKIHQNGFDICRDLIQKFFGSFKRAVGTVTHKDFALQSDHGNFSCHRILHYLHTHTRLQAA